MPLFSSPGDSVADMLSRRSADLGIAGLYVTKERNDGMEISMAHSIDCAGFLTLSSTSLPRSRAILGPFQWPVWVCLTLTYMVAIIPLAYSDRLTLSHLWGNYGEIENMYDRHWLFVDFSYSFWILQVLVCLWHIYK